MQGTLQNRFFLILLGIITTGFVFILIPFWGAIFWAIALTILFYPIYQWVCKLTRGRRSLASILTLFIAILIVIIPLTLITFQVINEATDMYRGFEDGDISISDIQDQIEEALPFIPETLQNLGIEVDDLGERIGSMVSASSQYIAEEAFRFGRNMFHFMISMAIMLYLAFFFFRDGERISAAIAHSIPLGKKREETLFNRFIKVTRATLKSTFIVAAVEGFLGWAILAVLGVSGAVLWGVLIGILSLIPALGSFLVWGPIAIYLFATGSIVQAVILTLFGTLVIGLVDNILRPMLVGRDIRLPDWLILLSILGGLGIFGIHGFIIGPIVTALFISLWNIFADEFDDGTDKDET